MSLQGSKCEVTVELLEIWLPWLSSLLFTGFKIMQHFIAEASMKSVSSQTPTMALAGILIFLLVPSVLDLPLLVKHSEVKVSQICGGRSRNKGQGFWQLQVCFLFFGFVFFFTSINPTFSCWPSLLVSDKKETQWKELNGKYLYIYGCLCLYRLCLYSVPNVKGTDREGTETKMYARQKQRILNAGRYMFKYS